MTQEIVPAQGLQLSPEQLKNLLLSSDHKSPVSIEGVARGRVPDTSIVAYFVVYKVAQKMGRIQVNEETYKALKAIFDVIKQMEGEALGRWILDAPNRVGV